MRRSRIVPVLLWLGLRRGTKPQADSVLWEGDPVLAPRREPSAVRRRCLRGAQPSCSEVSGCLCVPLCSSPGTGMQTSLLRKLRCVSLPSLFRWPLMLVLKPKCLHSVKSHFRGRVVHCNASRTWPGRCLRRMSPLLSAFPGRGGVGNGRLHGTDTPTGISQDCICPKP